MKTKTMSAYVYDGSGVARKEVAVPKPRPNDVLARVHCVSICGSDFHIFANDEWARDTITPGMVIGHEGAGFVEEVGEEVSGLAKGDYVALESHYACPPCEQEGRTADNCPHYGIIGIHGAGQGDILHQAGGVFAEYVSIPHYCCHKLSETIREKVYPSLLEPAGNSWEIIRFFRERGLPENLAIHGCGPHGLNMQLFARHAGVKNIVAFETDPWRLDFARRFGAANHVLDPARVSSQEIKDLAGGRGFDAAIDMVGNISVVEECEDNVRDGGMVVLFGLPRHEANVVHGEGFAQIIFHNEEYLMEREGKKFLLRGFTGRTQKTWEELILALGSSGFLRERLSLPLRVIGGLDELDNFIRAKPEHFLKIGMGAFV